MSFYKITDPIERRRMFEKLAKTRKNVREQFLGDKIGKIDSSESLKTFFKPITESQKESTREIKEQFTPIREQLMSIPTLKNLIVPLSNADAGDGEEVTNIGPIAAQYLGKYLNPDEVDATFGMHNDMGTWKIGNKPVKVERDDFIIQGERYPGTRGLWELIVKDEPSEESFNDDDLETYSNILIKTNSIRRNNDPNSSYPKASRSWKWTNIVKPIWQNRNRPTHEGQGTKTTVIPSDPNALLERLDLLMASKNAGNTGTRNELVSICDELLRQKVVNKKQYKNILSRL